MEIMGDYMGLNLMNMDFVVGSVDLSGFIISFISGLHLVMQTRIPFISGLDLVWIWMVRTYKKIILEGSLSTVSNPILQSNFSSYSIKKAHYCTVTNATVSQI